MAVDMTSQSLAVKQLWTRSSGGQFIGSDKSGGASNYAPILARSFQGANGDTIPSSIISSGRTQYSNAVTGPHGETTNMRCSLQSGAFNAFGGRLAFTQQPMSVGDTIWLRWYQYLPTAFCAGYQTGTDGWGVTKWMRLQWGIDGAGASRATMQIGGFAADACGNPATTPDYWGVSVESFSGSGGSTKQFATQPYLPRDQWVACQFAIHIAQNGWLRGWINDDYLGQNDFDTRPDALAADLTEIVIGNYWNGGTPSTTEWYMQDVICTIDVPNTTDGGGRPYIAPTAKAGDFA